MNRFWGMRSPRTPNGSRYDKGAGLPWYSPINLRAAQWYRYIAYFLLANVALKLVLMTVAAVPGVVENFAWLGPLRPPDRDWKADFPVPHTNAPCARHPPLTPATLTGDGASMSDELSMRGGIQTDGGGFRTDGGFISGGGASAGGYGAPAQPLDPVWNSRLMQVLGVLTEASSNRDVWSNSSLVGNMTERVAHALSGRTCSKEMCNYVLQIPKVAMMFLSKSVLHHEELWRRWFELAKHKLPMDNLAASVCGSAPVTEMLLQVAQQVCTSPQGADAIAQQYLFSVYVHIPPAVTDFPKQSLFYKHILTARTMTRWGSFELVLAAKLLLREALLEPTNAFFVMVSESDVPLYPPAVVYRQILAEGRSRIDACGIEDTSLYRWRPVMGRAGVPRSRWRKSWQWFMLSRTHAQVVVDDNAVHWAFERFCNPSPDETAREGGFDCYSDEHYIPTLLSVLGRENETSCTRTITNVDWRTGGAHPRAYTQRDLSSSRIRSLRQPHKRCGYTTAIRSGRASLVDVGALTGDPPLHDQLCAATPPTYSVALNPKCPLFARKFVNETSGELLKLFGDCSKRLYIITDEQC